MGGAQGAEGVEQGGLSCAAGADDSDKLAGGDAERYIGEDGNAGHRFIEMAGIEARAGDARGLVEETSVVAKVEGTQANKVAEDEFLTLKKPAIKKRATAAAQIFDPPALARAGPADGGMTAGNRGIGQNRARILPASQDQPIPQGNRGEADGGRNLGAHAVGGKRVGRFALPSAACLTRLGLGSPLPLRFEDSAVVSHIFIGNVRRAKGSLLPLLALPSIRVKPPRPRPRGSCRDFWRRTDRNCPCPPRGSHS